MTEKETEKIKKIIVDLAFNSQVIVNTLNDLIDKVEAQEKEITALKVKPENKPVPPEQPPAQQEPEKK